MQLLCYRVSRAKLKLPMPNFTEKFQSSPLPKFPCKCGKCKLVGVEFVMNSRTELLAHYKSLHGGIRKPDHPVTRRRKIRPTEDGSAWSRLLQIEDEVKKLFRDAEASATF